MFNNVTCNNVTSLFWKWVTSFIFFFFFLLGFIIRQAYLNKRESHPYPTNFSNGKSKMILREWIFCSQTKTKSCPNLTNHILTICSICIEDSLAYFRKKWKGGEKKYFLGVGVCVFEFSRNDLFWWIQLIHNNSYWRSKLIFQRCQTINFVHFQDCLYSLPHLYRFL